MNSTWLLSKNQVDLINHYEKTDKTAFCSKCGKDKAIEYAKKCIQEKRAIREQMAPLFDSIPLVNLQNPKGWDYEPIEIVTGQATIGTGIITEFTSSITDTFGLQSGRHNKKLKKGEDLCFTQLKKQTLDLGGNAVIGIDVDYSELGSLKGIIMVCMTGTAVRLKNTNILSHDRMSEIGHLTELNTQLLHLETFNAESLLVG